MLQKVAIHQTRLRIPGVGVDARGVCMGARGLVLLPGLDRLVAFLAIYTREVALTQVLASMKPEVVRSALGAREVAMSFDAVSSDVMDRVAAVARLTGAFTFTGTTRHFVQYRDAAAPFGYDAVELLKSNAELCLYHDTFSQAYDLERTLELRQLVERLSAEPTQASGFDSGAAWVLAAAGLGPPLVRHFAAAGIAARAALLAPKSELGLGSSPWLFRLDAVPPRLRGLLTRTPGLSLFLEKTEGAAVAFGYEHPWALAALPVFRPGELVLFPGENRPALVLELPSVFAPVATLVEPRAARLLPEDAVQVPAAGLPRVATRVRLLPSVAASRRLAAARLVGAETEQLRKLSYIVSPQTLSEARIAATDQGVFLIQPVAGPAIPLGALYAEAGDRIYVPLGYELVSRLAPELLLASMQVPEGHLLFFHGDGTSSALPAAAFAPLAQALLDPSTWTEPTARAFREELAAQLPTLWLDTLGLRPLKRADEA
ncbi:MAG TPA: hypothetical protein VI197_05000 [Polyangiaceae bacterium]